MTPEGQKLLEASLRLTEADRVAIAESLLESIPEGDGMPNDEAPDDGWSTELQRRLAESRRTGDRGIPWDEIKNQL